MSVHIRNGRGWISLEGPLFDPDYMERELRDALPELLELIDAELDPILRSALPVWPVKTGKTKESLRRDYKIEPDRERIYGTIDGLPDIRYIRSTRIGKKWGAVRTRSPLQEHLRKPLAEARRRFRAALPDVVARTIERLARGVSRAA